MLAQATPTQNPLPIAPARRLHGYQLALLTLTVVAQLLVAGTTAVLYRHVQDLVGELPKTVVAPATLGGRPRTDGTTTDALIAQVMRGQPTWHGTAEVKAFYGNPEAGLLLHAVAGSFNWSAGELDYLFYDLRVGGIAVYDVAPVPAGPLGGQASCGQVSDGTTIVCAWADPESLGTIVWYGSSLDAARAEFIDLRGEVQVVKPMSEW
ncbi:hypothetical protein Cme02nite_26220 [Catellatospora methionotrophica]|uniref:Uncharacterized protein n=1 Tax=Catellatospora methionotrophica TaxID=121620 RepID=A0A8J3LGX7_9ACTN|nr:hypothetical protein [Catellatospora methionotrophica]GIG14290.1 hypothetical protein Cme02nite_26220 [Catellatospora methionotrophica]